VSKVKRPHYQKDDDGGPYILIEGSKSVLESLAPLIIEHAQRKRDTVVRSTHKD
jgi:hypothetical protein